MSENINYRRQENLASYINDCEGLAKAALSRSRDKFDGYAGQQLNEIIDSIFNAIKRIYEEMKDQDFPERSPY